MKRLQMISFARLVFLMVALGINSTVAADDRAYLNYLHHCRGCHLYNGEAIPAADVPSQRELGRFLESAESRRHLIQVPGVSHTPMSDKEVADVLNWVIENFNPKSDTNNFKPFTASDYRIQINIP